MTQPGHVADLVATLRQRGLTIATAESLTAGMVSAALADVSGASATLAGGVVAYNNGIKHRVLGVAAQTLAQLGAVSGQTAAEMATGVRKLFATDIAVATTGNAGPTTSEGKAVGVVFIALATPAGVETQALHLTGDRQMIRSATVAAVFQQVTQWLNRAD